MLTDNEKMLILALVLVLGGGETFVALIPEGSFSSGPEKDAAEIITDDTATSRALVDSTEATSIDVSEPGYDDSLPITSGANAVSKTNEVGSNTLLQ